MDSDNPPNQSMFRSVCNTSDLDHRDGTLARLQAFHRYFDKSFLALVLCPLLPCLLVDYFELITRSFAYPSFHYFIESIENFLIKWVVKQCGSRKPYSVKTIWNVEQDRNCLPIFHFFQS